jgi:hypothetical protein
VTATLDPVRRHLAELDRTLHGPGAMKRGMIAEVRDGLEDAVAGYREGGLDPQGAATAAVRDFGSVREVAPLLQEELTARQGRRTAQLLLVAFPAMLIAWELLWTTGNGWSAPPPAAVSVLSRAIDILTVLITIAALVLLLVTFRGCRLPPWITRLIGLVATLGVVGCSGMSVVMNLLTPQQAADMFTTQPAVVAVGVMSAAASALVTRSAVRSLRFARASRRSDQRADPQVG